MLPHHKKIVLKAVIECMSEIEAKPMLEMYEDVADLYDAGEITSADIYGVISECANKLTQPDENKTIDVLSIIREDMTPEQFACGDFDSIKLGLGNSSLVSSQKGDIDNTSYAHVVRHFDGPDVHVKLEGWNSSYSGDLVWEDDDYSLVIPQEKTITIWE